MTVSSTVRLKLALERCKDRLEADHREYWEAWELNMGKTMYNKWLTCYEFLEAELGIESLRMQPENLEIRKHHETIGAELPWLRLCAPPLYKREKGKMFDVSCNGRIIFCRFEGRYKWTWTIWVIQNPKLFFGQTIHVDSVETLGHPEAEGNAMCYTKAAWEEADLEFSDRLKAEVGEIGTNFSIQLGSDLVGWIEIVTAIVDVERRP